MTEYSKLVEALRCENTGDDECGSSDCPYWSGLGCMDGQLMEDAAAAIEALQAEVQFYKALADEWQSSAENKERLLGLYRAEQAKHFYSAMDDNGRIIATPCVCMNIPVFRTVRKIRTVEKPDQFSDIGKKVLPEPAKR